MTTINEPKTQQQKMTMEDDIAAVAFTSLMTKERVPLEFVVAHFELRHTEGRTLDTSGVTYHDLAVAVVAGPSNALQAIAMVQIAENDDESHNMYDVLTARIAILEWIT